MLRGLSIGLGVLGLHATSALIGWVSAGHSLGAQSHEPMVPVLGFGVPGFFNCGRGLLCTENTLPSKVVSVVVADLGEFSGSARHHIPRRSVACPLHFLISRYALPMSSTRSQSCLQRSAAGLDGEQHQALPLAQPSTTPWLSNQIVRGRQCHPKHLHDSLKLGSECRGEGVGAWAIHASDHQPFFVYKNCCPSRPPGRHWFPSPHGAIREAMSSEGEVRRRR